MKRQHRTMTLIIATLVISVFVMASGSFASPNFGADCGSAGCHTTLGTTLSVNATGTIQATRGVSFLLVIDAGDGVGAVSMQSGVADNEDFTISDDVVEDGDPEDTNGNTGEIQASITFTPTSTGSFVIRIWSASTGGFGRSLDIDVTVSENTETTTGTTTGTTTEPTTTPPPTGMSEEEKIELWYAMMYILTPVTAIILIIVGFVIIRRAR